MSNQPKYNTIRYADTIPSCVLENLETFRTQLERAYFSNVLLRITKNEENLIEVGIEIQSNFWLSESICYYNNYNWLKGESNPNTFRLQQFYCSFSELKSNSAITIDISEFAIYLHDTSLIISKVYKNSITNQLDAILSSVITNMNNLIDTNLELPTEIHMPVLYEDKKKLTNDIKNSYFGFWGLYYESEEDAVIYDVNNNTISKVDLFMVNHIENMENL